MKLKNKLLISYTLAALLPITVLSFLVYENAKNSLISLTSKNMTSILESRKTMIEDYFTLIQAEIRSLSKNPAVLDAMNEFNDGFNQISNDIYLNSELPTDEIPQDDAVNRSILGYLDNQFGRVYSETTGKQYPTHTLLSPTASGRILQNLYISSNKNPLGSKNNLLYAEDGSKYSSTHKKYHPFFNEILKSRGYYDIFLLEPEFGTVVYSVYKEMDYGLPMSSGPLKNSGLAEAYRNALNMSKSNEPTATDFAFYTPSYEAPASFIASPIFDNNALAGVLVFQMPVDKINEIVTRGTNSDESAKSYLVGKDGLLRSQMPDIEDSTILNWEIDLNSLQNITKDNFLNTNSVDYNNNPVLQSFEKLDIVGQIYTLIIEFDKDAQLEPLEYFRFILLITLVIAILFALSIAVLVIRSTLNTLGTDPKELINIANSVANGDYSKDLSSFKNDNNILASMANMQGELIQRNENDKRTMGDMTRLSQGLDQVKTPIIITDSDLRVTFVNSSMKQWFSRNLVDIKSVYPGAQPDQILSTPVLDFFGSNLKQQIDNLTDNYHCELQIGSRILEITFSAIFSPTKDRVGTAVEVIDVTKTRAVMIEVQDIVNSAEHGKLDHRISMSDKQGVNKTLCKNINELLDVTAGFVSDIKDFAKAISTGDLTRKITTEYHGTFNDVKTDANLSIEQLKEVMSKITVVAGTVESAAKEINDGNLDLSQRTERAAASLEETSSSMEEMTASVSKTAENSLEAHKLALDARTEAEKGGIVVGDAVEAMKDINESSRKIADITGVIDDIAFQTNLLALNASVEAARAGEQGRGFAVVASEVRNLAGRSATAAKEIKDLIEDSVKRVENGAKLVNESGDTLDEIVTQVKKVTDIVSNISGASQEQSEGISLVNAAITNLDETTQQNAVLVEQASSASQSTTTQTDNLIELIQFFKFEPPAQSFQDSQNARKVTTLKPSAKALSSNNAPPKVSANSSLLTMSAKQATTGQSDNNWEEF